VGNLAVENKAVSTSRQGTGTFINKVADLAAQIKKSWVSYVFIAPYMLLFFLFFIIPVVTSIYLSFTYFNMLQSPRWIGWTNYRLLFLDDDIFILALKNTVVFAIIAGPVGYVASFTLAWLINQLKYRMVYTLAFYAPSITSGIAMGVIWLYFFSSDRYGLINHFLISLGVLQEPFLWLEDVRTILPVIILVSLWMSMGSGFLAFIAGLQNIDTQLYEAGRVDGVSNAFQEIWFITLPLMKPMLLFGAVMAVVGSFNVFGIAMQLSGLPSPLYAGHTIMTHLYDYAFIRYEMGYASAISVVLFIMMFGLNRILMRLLSTKGEY